MNEHERRLIEIFVTPDKKDSYLALLRSKNGRDKFINELPRFKGLDKKYALKSELTNKKDVIKELTSGGSESCYVISASKKYDTKTMPIKEAVDSIYEIDPGAIISCIPGKLIYYEGADERSIYKR
jgi:hypothetical protein